MIYDLYGYGYGDNIAIAAATTRYSIYPIHPLLQPLSLDPSPSTVLPLSIDLLCVRSLCRLVARAAGVRNLNSLAAVAQRSPPPSSFGLLFSIPS